MSTSLAQVFDEIGLGVILRGTPVVLDKNDRRPYMSEQQAYDLLSSALSEDDKALMQMPARIVFHKTSKFRDTDIRLFSNNSYPPLSGTLLSLSESEGVLYTRGMIEFYKTYPGAYIPNPLRLDVYENDSSLEELAEVVLGLTKMNWNNTLPDDRLPITLECEKKVGEIMKYVDINEKPQVRDSFYM